MPDIRLIQIGALPQEAVTIDWLMLPNKTLDETQALATAAIVALGTDARARVTDILPGLDDDDRRGWWGDHQAEDLWDGWPIGTRIWLLRRDKITGPGARQGATVARAETYVREALQPFVERRFCSRIAVRAERTGRERIEVVATVFRGPQLAIELRYQALWDELKLVE